MFHDDQLFFRLKWIYYLLNYNSPQNVYFRDGGKLFNQFKLLKEDHYFLYFTPIIEGINAINVFHTSLDNMIIAKEVSTLFVAKSFKAIIKTHPSINESYPVILLFVKYYGNLSNIVSFLFDEFGNLFFSYSMVFKISINITRNVLSC
jgi:hypothetical protein